MKRFGYWRDPLFLLGCLLYGMNRWGLKPHTHSPFLRGQFNDLLLIPCALPLVLLIQRRLGLRRHDAFPTGAEILLHWAVWSVLCEVIGPHLLRVTGDWRDVLAYATGAGLAWLWWRRESSAAPKAR